MVPLASVGSLTLLVVNGTARVLVMMRFSTAGRAFVVVLKAAGGVAVIVTVFVGAARVVRRPSDPQAPSTSRALAVNAALMACFMIPLASGSQATQCLSGPTGPLVLLASSTSGETGQETSAVASAWGSTPKQLPGGGPGR